jgi:hypothetical protein
MYIKSVYTLPHQIAECNELVVAKIARLDFPLNWSVDALQRNIHHYRNDIAVQELPAYRSDVSDRQQHSIAL